MYDNRQFRNLIIQPTLHALDLYSQEAEDLLIGTIAQESNGGTYLVQKSNANPLATLQAGKLAVGPFQMEPRTHDDIWANYLGYHKPLADNLRLLANIGKDTQCATMMLYNLYYATSMARIFYLRCPGLIPTTLEGQAAYYKRFYNTALGAATPEQYIANYQRFNGLK